MDSIQDSSSFAKLREQLQRRFPFDGTNNKKLGPVLKDPHFGRSIKILFSAGDSILSFLTLHDFLKNKIRSARTGAPTDAEQDLLRAMLLFAGAGLDSALKQLIKDALPEAIRQNADAKANLESYVESQIRDLNKKETRELLSRLLLSDSPQKAMVQRLVQELCSESLQSTPQLFRIAKILSIDDSFITKRKEKLDKIFRIRQEIAHEMDIDMNLPNRKRRRHTRTQMVDYSDELVITGLDFLKLTGNVLRRSS